MKAEEIYQHCRTLADNPAARWLIERAVTEPMSTLDVTIHDLTLTKKARKAALHEWNALKKVAEFLAEQEKFALNQMKRPQ